MLGTGGPSGGPPHPSLARSLIAMRSSRVSPGTVVVLATALALTAASANP